MSTTLTPILAAAVTAESSASDILAYQSVGFIIVLGSLAFLAIVIAIVGKFFQKTPTQAAAPAAKPVSANAVSAPVASSDSIPAHIVAVIAAAVAIEVGQRHQIVAVTRVGNNWSMEGRRSIFASKTPRRR